MAREFLSIDEAAAVLGISRDTVWRMLRLGELHGTRFGRVWRISRREIDRLVDDGGTGRIAGRIDRQCGTTGTV